MTWKLFLDDERDPPQEGYTIARSSMMAVHFCVEKKTLPEHMSLDHDLGDGDTTMRFLNELFELWVDRGSLGRKFQNTKSTAKILLELKTLFLS